MDELPTEHFEHAEHAKHVAEHGSPFLGIVAMSIAVLAVMAATVGSLETLESGAAISAKNEAILFQSKATDSWNFFQAKSIKKNMYEIAAAGGGPNQDEFTKQAKKNSDDSISIQSQAKQAEDEAAASLGEGARHEQRHHILTVAVTLLHVAIAIATISIITGGKLWPWRTSLALGAAGVIAAGAAYLIA